jgi:cytochrome d ubiquinol oxidase subunit I
LSIYGALRTADAVTPTLTAQAVTISLIIFAVVYLVIFSFGTLYVYRLLKIGPVEVEPVRAANPKRPLAVSGGSPIVETTQGGGLL